MLHIRPLCYTTRRIPSGGITVKLERYREDMHGPCASTTRKSRSVNKYHLTCPTHTLSLSLILHVLHTHSLSLYGIAQTAIHRYTQASLYLYTVSTIHTCKQLRKGELDNLYKSNAILEAYLKGVCTFNRERGHSPFPCWIPLLLCTPP